VEVGRGGGIKDPAQDRQKWSRETEEAGKGEVPQGFSFLFLSNQEARDFID